MPILRFSAEIDGDSSLGGISDEISRAARTVGYVRHSRASLVDIEFSRPNAEVTERDFRANVRAPFDQSISSRSVESPMRFSHRSGARHLSFVVDLLNVANDGRTLMFVLSFGPLESYSEVQCDSILRAAFVLDLLRQRGIVSRVVLEDDEAVYRHVFSATATVAEFRPTRELSRKRATREFLRWADSLDCFSVNRTIGRDEHMAVAHVSIGADTRHFVAVNNLLNGAALPSAEKWYDIKANIQCLELKQMRVIWECDGGLAALVSELGEPTARLGPYDPVESGLSSLERVVDQFLYARIDSEYAVVFREYEGSRIACNVLPSATSWASVHDDVTMSG